MLLGIQVFEQRKGEAKRGEAKRSDADSLLEGILRQDGKLFEESQI